MPPVHPLNLVHENSWQFIEVMITCLLGGGTSRAAQELGLDQRGMKFARDIRRQLEGVLSSKLDYRGAESGKGVKAGGVESERRTGRKYDSGVSSLLQVQHPPAVDAARKAICSGYGNHLARRMQVRPEEYQALRDGA